MVWQIHFPLLPPALPELQLKARQFRNPHFQLEELKRQQKIRTDAEDLTNAMRASGAKAMQQKREQELARQNNCSHMKPWGGSAIAGQRDHSQTIHWICQFCAKEWKGMELPSNLRIPGEKVGGPDN